tara:strand:+ start:2526 stop:2768 length:243 start_codon:yes stop_codon:yes gene_type:complete
MKKINIKFVLKKLIRVYQLVVSPYLGNNCRFYPSCSNYAIEAIEKFGALKGSKMAFFRILKCNPWGGSGIDMVEDKDVKN